MVTQLDQRDMFSHRDSSQSLKATPETLLGQGQIPRKYHGHTLGATILKAAAATQRAVHRQTKGPGKDSTVSVVRFRDVKRETESGPCLHGYASQMGNGDKIPCFPLLPGDFVPKRHREHASR